MEITETEIRPPESTESALADAVETVAQGVAMSTAHAVADVAGDTLRVLQEENASLRAANESKDFRIAALSEELANATREPDITVITVEAPEPEVAPESTVPGVTETEPATIVETQTTPATAASSESSEAPKARRRPRPYGRR